MATMNITINTRDPMAAIEVIADIADKWDQGKRDKFADEFNRMCDDRSALNFSWENGTLVAELSPKAMALLRKFGIGEVM